MTHLLDGLVSTLLHEYGELSDSKVIDLVNRWSNWVNKFETNFRLNPLPFSYDEREYLNSQFVHILNDCESKKLWDVFEYACQKGNLAVVEWIDSFKGWQTEDDHHYFSGLKLACINGHLNVAKWLSEKGLVFEQGSSYAKWKLSHIIEKTCEQGHIPIVLWLLSNMTFLKDEYKQNMFVETCKHGHLELVKILRSKFPDMSIELGIELASKYGQLEIVQYLSDYNLSDDVINQAFYNASRKGHLDVLKWFYCKFPNLDIRYLASSTGDAFQVAYKYGHLLVCKWLLNILNPKKCPKTNRRSESEETDTESESPFIDVLGTDDEYGIDPDTFNFNTYKYVSKISSPAPYYCRYGIEHSRRTSSWNHKFVERMIYPDGYGGIRVEGHDRIYRYDVNNNFHTCFRSGDHLLEIIKFREEIN